MGSLYSKYIKEREGANILENDKAFCSYRLEDKGLFICDIYVDEKYRKSNIGKELVDEVESLAKEKGLKESYCTVCVTSLNIADSCIFVRKCGYEPINAKGTLIYFKKVL